MAHPPRRRLGWVSLGFREPNLRRALAASGIDLKFAPVARDLDGIAVWGARPAARRGLRYAKRRDLPVFYLEDAYLRAIGSHRRVPSVGLTIDSRAPYFDASRLSDLEVMLNASADLTTAEHDRARTVMAMLREAKLSKYNDDFRAPDDLPRDFVLVVDQVPGDAAIRLGGANSQTFATMLAAAQAEHPDKLILIKGHPRGIHGHFAPGDATQLAQGYNIYDVLARSAAVYTVSSLVGFEAIVVGHRPVIFGQPFYAGWGLSDDRNPVARRTARLTREALFARAFLDYPHWFDPAVGRRVAAEDAINALIERKRHFGWVKNPPVGLGMWHWKRKRMRAFLGDARFTMRPAVAVKRAQAAARPLVVWGRDAVDDAPGDLDIWRVEDGFLRSRGIGAKLIPPLSVCLDQQGIYYDTARPNDLADLIARSAELPDHKRARARRLRQMLTELGLSKYNQGQGVDDRADILVVGQVEDDASVVLAAGDINTNEALLTAARAANRSARIAYKPHPDVEAGLRKGGVGDPVGCGLADAVWRDKDPISAIRAVDEVWTMTSLLGFEALLHGVNVTCTGRPFYAGWGLTTDVTVARNAPVTLDGLVHATLIDYPRYFDPVSGLASTPEVIVERLSSGFSEAVPYLWVARLASAINRRFSKW